MALTTRLEPSKIKLLGRSCSVTVPCCSIHRSNNVIHYTFFCDFPLNVGAQKLLTYSNLNLQPRTTVHVAGMFANAD